MCLLSAWLLLLSNTTHWPDCPLSGVSSVSCPYPAPLLSARPSPTGLGPLPPAHAGNYHAAETSVNKHNKYNTYSNPGRPWLRHDATNVMALPVADRGMQQPISLHAVPRDSPLRLTLRWVTAAAHNTNVMMLRHNVIML